MGETNGGIRPPMPPGTPPFWLVYFAVEDLDAAVAKVTELGGAVLGEPTDIGIARIAIATDPQARCSRSTTDSSTTERTAAGTEATAAGRSASSPAPGAGRVSAIVILDACASAES